MTLLLLSGGMDSAVCLNRYGASLAVGFNYGQPHAIELNYAMKLAKYYHVPFEVHILGLLPKTSDVVFAGRNAVMIATAAAIAQDRGLSQVMIGCNASDADVFPDCRPEFIAAMGAALSGAYGIAVVAPLLHMTKAEIRREHAAHLVPETWSCYAPQGLVPCGKCMACVLLEEGVTP